MFRAIILSLILIFILKVSNAQSWVWAKSLGNIKSDKIISIKTDDSGYVYISGYFSTSINIGTNNLFLNYTANSSSKEIFLAKLDSLGYCYWARSGGEHFDDRVLGMDVDSAGNSVITGTFWEGSGINMNGVNVTGNAYGWGDQCFIYKHDRNGNTLWGRFVCSESGDDQGLDVATDKYGNNYIVGFMSGTTLYCGGNTVTATNTNSSPYRYSYWITKLNKDGVFLWAQTFGRLPIDTPSTTKYAERDIAVDVDDNGGVYITGGYNGNTSFGGIPKTSINNSRDIFVTKYDTNGTFKWVTTGGSSKDDWSNGICADNKGNIYITGEHRDSLIIDTVLIKNYDGRDVFIAKLDATTGKPYWGKRAGSNLGSERGNDVWADTNCNVYVCGDIQGGAKFGDNITTPIGKSLEAFVAKISVDGKWIWASTGGGTDSNDRGNAITKGNNAQLYTCGFFRAPANFGTNNLFSFGSSDGFYARLKDSLYGVNTEKLKQPTDTTFCEIARTSMFIPEYSFLNIMPNTQVTINSTNDSLIFTPTTTTTYTVTLNGKGSCAIKDTITFTIFVNKNPVADFYITPSVALITNPVFTLNNKTASANTFEWYFNNALESTATNYTKNVGATLGNYCFTLLATNNFGCFDSVTHCADVLDVDKIFFPNSFSPNNDGRNDKYGVVFNNRFTKFEFFVYNRWGEKVWETNDPKVQWDGKTKFSKDADIGTYYYHCRYTTLLNNSSFKKGEITLIR